MPAKMVSCRRERLSSAPAAPLAAALFGLERGLLEVRELAEERKAFLDFAGVELLEPLGSEALHGEGAHDTAVEHGAAEDGGRERGLRGDVAEESAGEGIARAGGIDNFCQWESGHAEGYRDAAGLASKGAIAEERRRTV